jgi:hypothetical protein
MGWTRLHSYLPAGRQRTGVTLKKLFFAWALKFKQEQREFHNLLLRSLVMR